jgi:hypothetical protein
VCDLECTDLVGGHVTLFYGDDYGGGSDCDVCGDDIIVINNNNSHLTANHVLCEPEWLVFLHFSWFIMEFIKVIKVWMNETYSILHTSQCVTNIFPILSCLFQVYDWEGVIQPKRTVT